MKRDNYKYILIIIGSLVGILTGYLRSFNPNSFLSLSDIASKYGFWIVTVSLIPCFAKSVKKARIYTLEYLLSMCIAYYSYLLVVNDIFYFKQLLFWCIFSIITMLFVKYMYLGLRKEIDRSYLILLIPLILLSLEILSLLNNFITYKTHFLQLAFDVFGYVVLLFLFYNNWQERAKTAGVSIGIAIIICLFFEILRFLQDILIF